MQSVIEDAIDDERSRQDEQWGGAEHDDEHDADEWESVIVKHANRLTGSGVCDRVASPDYRARLIKIAAIAIAAIESFDRRNK
jgi:hypothetical protein